MKATSERLDLGSRLGKLERTGVGGVRVPARLTRTGVLKYRDPSMPDGWRRELRLPEEVFKPESIATLEHVPVIDIAHHKDMVSPETWRKVTRGHVANVRRDGKYLVADLHVNDADALEAIDYGDRLDISCGYTSRIEWTSGVHDGEPYDCIQRDITYNHVALCPPNVGRAGRDVALCLSGSCTANCDAADEPAVDVDARTIEVVATVTSARDGKAMSWTRDLVTPVRFADGTTIGRLAASALSARNDGTLSAVLRLDDGPLASQVLSLASAGMLRAVDLDWRERADGDAFLHGVKILPLGKGHGEVARRAKSSHACTCVPPSAPARDYSAAEIKDALRADSKTRASRVDRPSMSATLTGIDVATRSVRVVASTPTPVDGTAIKKWDLERFAKNPCALWAHDPVALPIGACDDVAFDPEVGLTCRVRFASEFANPMAEMVWRGVQEGMIKAVSVGYDYDAASGVAKLVEVSFVPVGADEDAGTAEVNPAAAEDIGEDDERRRARLSNAGRELAGARNQRGMHGTCAACGAQSIDTDKPCPHCGERRQTADAKEDDVMTIENALKKNREYTQNAWRNPPKEVEARLDEEEERRGAAIIFAPTPMRLASDAPRVKAILRSADEVHVDAEEDADTRAFNARCDELERADRLRADAREREAANDPIARARAKRDAWSYSVGRNGG